MIELRPATDHVDVLIIGAGISGIGAAWHLQDEHPGRSYAILEGRDAIGGTWDLFRYPGIRSDSDLHTFGYAFKPWTGDKAIADGDAIRAYVRETAEENGIDRHIRFGHKAVRAEWSSGQAQWTVEVERTDTGETFTMTAGWLFSACGYYRYDEGFTPELPGLDRFGGQVIHPQHWPEDLDYAGKRVVVIGSGATAVTLVPAMTGEAEHVTMLQRSPTYVIPLPSEDVIANSLRRVLGPRRAHHLTRRKNIWLQQRTYRLSQRRPKLVRRIIRSVQRGALGRGYDLDTHFTPRYDPWDQRLCVVPDGDLFRVLREGAASIVTNRIETFTETGIRLESGTELDADIIITATGLNLLAFGGMQFVVDGREIALPDTLAYKGTMLSGVPNFAFAIGYTNSSWTLKVNLVCEYFCRLVAHLDARGHDACVPHVDDPDMATQPLLDFSAGYVQRSVDRFPRQGASAPWQLSMNYAADIATLRDGTIDDGTLRFLSARSGSADERFPALAA
ncbi:MAG TPA: NAD(P)/FAD-dependent oxidoreductase [Solirubrobacteraceae bacterium]|nr:NAD(P)/FAD-dependent oxidoreductase [Solirubrobacteraceae bacterium]